MFSMLVLMLILMYSMLIPIMILIHIPTFPVLFERSGCVLDEVDLA
jgi:hypothetical protein